MQRSREGQEDRRTVYAWAMYDWANSAFATVVLAGFFPLLFQDYWNSGVDGATANLRLGWANAGASLIIALSAPLLGAVADRTGRQKRFLAAFGLLGVLGTALLAGVPAGGWLAASVLFVAASVGFMGANIFYDALLVSVAPPSRWDAISGLGYGLGYLGGGLLYLGCVLAALMPERIGFASATEAALFAFVATAVWWAVFPIPRVRRVRDPPAPAGDRHAWHGGWRQVGQTLAHLRRYRSAATFLIAYWLYIDGVGTVIRMAVAYGRSLGFEQSDLIVALLVTQFVGFPAAIVYGRLGQRFGPRRGIYAGLVIYTLICVWGAFIRAPWEFYGIAVLVGLVQGGVQSLSRSYFARLIPSGKSAEFFGFYNLLGKFAALIGPPLFGLFGAWFGVRYSMIAVIILFFAGGLVLSRVKEEAVPEAHRAPAEAGRRV